MTAARLRVDLVAPPFAGHLHPIIAAALAIQSLAAVRIISTPAAMSRIQQAGLCGIPILAEVDQTLAEIANPAKPAGSNPLRLWRQFQSSFKVMEAFARALDELYRSSAPDDRPQLLIADFTVGVAGPVAKRYGITWWTSHPSPCVIETADGPPAYLGGLVPRDDLIGRLRDYLGRRSIRSFKRLLGVLHKKRLAALGIPRIYRSDGTEAAYSGARILALGLPEFEFAHRWPPAVTFIGPLLWSPPGRGPALPVVTGDTRHILVTLGTHQLSRKQNLLTALNRVAQAYPHWQLHFSAGGHDELQDLTASAPANLHVHTWVDYPTWVPRMDAVLHHGGAGILWECLRAGVPQLVLPQDYDQFDHAARLEAAGLVRRLRHLRDLAAALAKALDTPYSTAAIAYQKALAPERAEQRLRLLLAQHFSLPQSDAACDSVSRQPGAQEQDHDRG